MPFLVAQHDTYGLHICVCIDTSFLSQSANFTSWYYRFGTPTGQWLLLLHHSRSVKLSTLVLFVTMRMKSGKFWIKHCLLILIFCWLLEVFLWETGILSNLFFKIEAECILIRCNRNSSLLCSHQAVLFYIWVSFPCNGKWQIHARLVKVLIFYYYNSLVCYY